mmetsp:Transcript_18193/g.34527  ORF Transcript_18193/g.34527 Transcript_18193/m.34527 type:complete len:232 (-) Transcript_18193:3-698(-)
MYSRRTQSFPSPSPREGNDENSQKQLRIRRRATTGVFPSPTCTIKASPSTGSVETVLKNRSVKFNETLNQVFPNKQWNKRDCLRRWYSKREITLMKEYSLALAKGRRNSKSASDESYKKVLLNVYDECCDALSDESSLSTLGQFSLRIFIGRSNSRIGLEKTSVGEIDFDKRCRRFDLVDIVLDAQATYKTGKPQAKAELIRMASESVSRPARLFARHIAAALASSLLVEG